MSRKLIISVGILLFSVLLTYFLSKQPILLSIILIFMAYIKHIIYPIKRELFWFLFVCIGGAIIEVLLVNSGSAWKYSVSQFYGIPIWIPFFWGTVSTTIVVIYDEFIKIKFH